MEELKKIIKELGEIEEIKPSDDAILECATRIYLSKKTSQSFTPRSTSRPYVEGKPTEKQMNFLKDKNYNIPEGLTFEEAKTIIGQIINAEKAEKSQNKIEESIY